MFQVAQQVMSDPQLFAFEVSFDKGFLQREPSNTGFDIVADYARPYDQTQYVRIGRSLNHGYRHPEAGVWFGVTPFVPGNSCSGTAPGVSFGNFPAVPPPPPPPVAEPESKHPPIQGWAVDLPQLWRIAKRHEALFANGVKRCLVTTVTRFREDDSGPKCGEWTVFNVPPSWNGPVRSELKKRLVNEQGRRAVIELVEPGLDVPQPGASPCERGHYLIIDAHSGVDLESGTYL